MLPRHFSTVPLKEHMVVEVMFFFILNLNHCFNNFQATYSFAHSYVSDPLLLTVVASISPLKLKMNMRVSRLICMFELVWRCQTDDLLLYRLNS